ncbi:MAG: MoxR family ATPase [Leptospirales bacterium]|nr:MoxR family ATPase [Leptospirales bacterium]
MEFRSTERYYLSPELGAIVNMAMVMERPLLLTGEPGTGKTQLAFEISRSLGMPLEVLRAKSTIRGEEACYVQDTVLRLNDARFGPGASGRDVNRFYDYVIWGPIGRAFRCAQRSVLLLDEIDKTESDVQDNLLDVLESAEFTIREVNETIRANHPPLILITSNAKRELSDPFLRRCFAHHIAFPTPDEMRAILRLHFSNLDTDLAETALRLFYELRQRGYEKAPATSELLNWVEALQRSATEASALHSARELPFIGALLKRSQDLLSYRGNPQHSDVR